MMVNMNLIFKKRLKNAIRIFNFYDILGLKFECKKTSVSINRIDKF